MSRQDSSKYDIKIREARPDDAKIIRHMFFVGTRMVVTAGVRKIMLKLKPLWIFGIIVGYLFKSWVLGLIIPLLIYVGLPHLFGLAFSAGQLFFDKDFKTNIISHYQKANSRMFIAEVDGKVAGMVAIEPANVKLGGHFKGLRDIGDAELKRMNVLSDFRGLGLSKVLFTSVEEFCKDCKYKRIILTTSSIQEVAYFSLYPQLGFKLLKSCSKFFDLVTPGFFAYELKTDK